MKKLTTSSLLLLMANMLATLFTILVLTASVSKASHISAGNITYQPQAGGQYLFRLTLYRDCAGVTMYPTEYLYAHSNNSCSPDITINVALIPNTGQQLPASACVQGGNCYEEYIYEGTAFLPTCNDWEIYYTTCCRNLPDNIDNINVPINDFYIYTTLNNSNHPGNSSPEFIYAPIGTFCVNNNFFFDQGATDPDGDILSFSLIGAMGFDGFSKANLFYNPPYSPSSPIPCVSPISINSQTGLISLTPSMAGKFVIVVAVTESDAVTGAYIGTTVRDMQVSVSANCNNIVPAFDASVVSSGISAGCGDSVITIPLSANIQCGTVASDGSDFLVTNNNGGAIVPLISASGTGCIIGLSNMVSLSFTGQLGAGSYTITVMNGTDNNTLLSECGMPMLTTNTVQLSVAGNFTLALTHTDLTCAPNSTGSITASATGLPGPFLYSIDGISYGPSNIFTGLAAGSYTVYAQTGGNCISSATVTINPSATVNFNINKTDITCFPLHNGTATAVVNSGAAPFTISWNTIPVQNAMTATGLLAGTYVATVTDANNCTSTATVTVNRPDSITVSAAGSDTICKGQQAVLTASATGGAGQFTYNWSPTMQGQSVTVSPLQTTMYQVTATDINGCTSAAASVGLAVRPGISFTTTSDTGLCQGGSINLSVSATGGNGGPFQIDWNNGASVSDTFTVTPSGTSTYTVTVSDGCTTPSPSKAILVEVYPNPAVSFTADTTTDCFPLFGNFHDLTTIANGDLTSWLWNFGDGMVSSEKNPHHTYTQPGFYTVSLHVTSDKGCGSDTTMPAYITVKPASKPVADFTYSPTGVTILDPSVSFINQSSGGIIYSWSFGDGSGISHESSPMHTFGDTGHFAVQLTVTNDMGCKSSAIKTVEVLPVSSLFMPNAFSPNGDGINDYFAAMSEYIAEADLVVFNRWGQKIFESGNLARGWDGTYRSEPAPEGVYTFQVKIKVSDLKSNVEGGSFLLVR